MPKLALAFVLALLAVACNKASDQDVDKMITLWGEISDGYLDVLEANQKEPKKAIEEGKKYIETDARVKALAKMANLRGTEEQADRFTRAVEAALPGIQERLGKVMEAMATAGDLESVKALEGQWELLIKTALDES